MFTVESTWAFSRILWVLLYFGELFSGFVLHLVRLAGYPTMSLARGPLDNVAKSPSHHVLEFLKKSVLLRTQFHIVSRKPNKIIYPQQEIAWLFRAVPIVGQFAKISIWLVARAYRGR